MDACIKTGRSLTWTQPPDPPHPQSTPGVLPPNLAKPDFSCARSPAAPMSLKELEGSQKSRSQVPRQSSQVSPKCNLGSEETAMLGGHSTVYSTGDPKIICCF